MNWLHVLIGAPLGLLIAADIVRAHRAQPLFRTPQHTRHQRGEGQVRGSGISHSCSNHTSQVQDHA